MSNAAPPEPPPSRGQSTNRDEQIAVFIAFAAIGTLLYWGLRQNPDAFNGTPFLLGGNRPEVQSGVEPAATIPPTPKAEESAPVEGAIAPTGIAPLEPETAAPRDEAAIAALFPTLFAQTEINQEINQEPISEPNEATVTPEAVTPPPPPAVVPVPVETPAAPGDTQTTLPENLINPNLPEPEAPKAFSDVPANHWAHLFIAGLSARGVTMGFPDGTFRPDQPVSRAELAAQIEKVFNLDDRQPPTTFNDVAGDFWAATAIKNTNQGGFLNGYPNRIFGPEREVSRLELLIALATGLQLPLPDNPDQILQVYQDQGQIPQWAKPKLAAATQAGLVTSSPNVKQLNPNNSATRADVASMMYQALVQAGKADPVPSASIVRP